MTTRLSVEQICQRAPVIPVLTIDRLEDAVPLAEALVAGGLPVLEITLRSPIALAALEAIAAACPGAIVGAGSVRTPADLAAVRAAGAVFGVSPGAPRALIDEVVASAFPFLPGCATATEAMELADRGFRIAKLFPAEQAGGVGTLKAWSGPLPGMRFCPTGGITADSAQTFLDLPNVVCVGGSWMAPRVLVDARKWSDIERLARAAARLG